MVFSSIPFLYYFLPAVLAVYFLTPRKGKNAVLLLASLIFYGWGELRLLPLMAFTILLCYVCGLGIERSRKRKKLWLLASIVISVGLLGVFKYADFFIGSLNAVTGLKIPLLHLALPIGISFYTFQCLSYTIDVYRGSVPAQKNLINFGAYVALFPQLIAGPIVRYADIARELEHREHSWENAAVGLRRFLVGLGKKVILADNFALLIRLFRQSGEKSVLFYWMYAVAFTLNIYFDFSGYSDMAIGLGRMLGFRFLENFNYPFLADSITDFWRRWHISMGTWFRDYVYIPLGGNKGGLAKQLRNIAIVWLLTGFWHGASWNFVLWGVYFGILLVLEKLFLLRWLKRLPAVLRHIYALVLVTISWTLFAFTEISKGAAWCKAMFSGVPFDSGSLYLLLTYGPMLAICALAATPLGKRFYEKLGTRLGQRALTVVDCGGLACVLVMAAAYLVSGSYNPFLYFRF